MSNHLRLSRNTKGRDFVVGDLHGAFDLLDRALAAVAFDPAYDRLISVGDLVDRGDLSAKCVEYLKQPWFFAIKGNHEDMFLDTVKDGVIDPDKFAFQIRNGMAWIAHLAPHELVEIEKLFKSLPVAIEIETERGTVGFVHADIPSGMTWQEFTAAIDQGDEKTIAVALWGRQRVGQADDSGVSGIDRLFFGHTPQEEGAKRLGNCYYIDTGAVFRQILDRDNQFHLTMADILSKTDALPANNNLQPEIRTVTEQPPVKKPFGKYAK